LGDTRRAVSEEGPFRLVDTAASAASAERAFNRIVGELSALLPAEALVEHIGATAVPGCLTKGDLDIVVRVPEAQFETAKATLTGRYARNLGSCQTRFFAAFADEAAEPPLGVQLVVIGSEFDDFTAFRDRLLADPALVARYNALKRTFDGQDMEVYRAAKSAFIAEALAGEVGAAPVPVQEVNGA
jgi:GrpB-like predicted nucleotidyltransferase (UPF0157 family)